MIDDVLFTLNEYVVLREEEIETKLSSVSSFNSDVRGYLQKDSIKLLGEDTIFRRLYIISSQSSQYVNVGWVIISQLFCKINGIEIIGHS